MNPRLRAALIVGTVGVAAWIAIHLAGGGSTGSGAGSTPARTSSSPAGAAATAPTPAGLSTVTPSPADSSVDNGPSDPPPVTGNAAPAKNAATHFADVLLEGPATQEAAYRGAVLALCTPEEAALFGQQLGIPPRGRIDTTRRIGAEWIGDNLAKVSVPVNIDGLDGGTGATLILTVDGATGRWLVSDIDLEKAGQS